MLTDKPPRTEGQRTDHPVDKAHLDMGPPLCLHGGLGFALALDRVKIFVSLITFLPMVERIMQAYPFVTGSRELTHR